MLSRIKPSVLVSISIALIKHVPKTTWGQKGSFCFVLQTMSHELSQKEVRAGIEGRNQEAGTEVATMKECFFLACFRAPIQFPVYTIQDQLTCCGTTHSEMDFPLLIGNQENAHRHGHRQLLSLGSFFPHVSSLNQADKN